MKGVRDSQLLPRWHRVYAASNPGLTRDSWEVDGVTWRRQRHSYWGADYSFQFEVHTLVREGRDKATWSLLVAVEHWWGPDRERGSRTVEWCRLLTGRAEAVQAWLKQKVPD
jgi:hypothetical protein